MLGMLKVHHMTTTAVTITLHCQIHGGTCGNHSNNFAETQWASGTNPTITETPDTIDQMARNRKRRTAAAKAGLSARTSSNESGIEV